MSHLKSWGDTYNKAIQSWTGKNGTTLKDNKVVFLKDLEFVSSKAGDVAKSLTKLDKIPLNTQDKAFSKNFSAFFQESKVLREVAKTYYVVRDNAIKKTNKNEYADVYRDLKVLRKHLEFVVARVEGLVGQYSKATAVVEEEFEQKKKEAGNDPQQLLFLK